MLAGYISGKKGIFNGDDAVRFNKVVLDYALPSALFVSIVRADREMLAHDMQLSVISLAGIMFCFMLVYLVFRCCFKGNTGADGAVSALISGSPAIGFLGFAVLEPIFGATPSVALVVAIVGIVVNAVGIPVGLSLLGAAGGCEADRGKDFRHSPVIRALAQPVAWAPVLAVVLVLCGLKWPEWASPSFDLMAKANASLAVFSAGITLSSVKIDINRQTATGCVMKLVLMPALLLAIGLIFHMDALNLKMLVVAGALPPAFSGIMIARKYDTFVATGTSSLALSVILFAGFCPFWIWAVDMCLKVF